MSQKMKYHFNSACYDSLVAASLEAIEQEAVWSSEDECFVVSVPCAKCGNEFWEEADSAKAKLVSGIKFFCIDCDKWASSPSGVNSVRMEIWFTV